MVAAAGAGPRPINHQALNDDNLAEAIQFCLSSEALKAASEIAQKMKTENGIMEAVDSFHRNLPISDLSCDLTPRQPAVWLFKKGKEQIKLSDKAAFILAKHKKIDMGDLEL